MKNPVVRVTSLVILATLVGGSVVVVGCSKPVAKTEVVETDDQAHMQQAKAAAEAEAAEEEFAKSKTATSKVKPVKRSVASVAPKKKTPTESVFIVQVGTFRVEENAKNILAKLKSAGVPAFQKTVSNPSGSVFYAVRVEPTPDRKEAEKFVASVKAATGESPLILSVER